MRFWILLSAITVCSLLLLDAGDPRAEPIKAGPRDCRAIAFTFDMCPVRGGRGYDEALIQTLMDRKIPATFFLSGRWIKKHDVEVQALLRVPFFELGTHGQAHAHLPLLDEEHQRREIQEAVELLRAQYGRQATLFRPPYGEYDDRTIRTVEALGLQLVLWNVVSGDPDPALSAGSIIASIKAVAGNGSILVFHANGKGRHTREVIEALYQDLVLKRGLKPVTISDLLAGCRS